MHSAAESPDVLALLRVLRGTDPGRPRLTWYGPDTERIELSAHVLENWVAKTANLLVTDLDVEPGDVVVVDLPPHWRTGIWMLALWAVGAHVVVVGESGHRHPTDAVGVVDTGTSASPAAATAAAQAGGWHVAVTLAPLALRHPALPVGAVDYAATVGGHGDVFVAVDDIPADTVALTVPDGTALLHRDPLLHRDLVAAAARTAADRGWSEGARVLDVMTTGTDGDPAHEVLTRWLAPWAVDGSLVLVHPASATDPAVVARAEQVTSTRV